MVRRRIARSLPQPATRTPALATAIMSTATHQLIWFVEDSPLAARMAISALPSGFRHEVIVSGELALERIARGEVPSVMVVDWELAEVSGLDVCRAVRASRDEVALPILMLTGKAETKDVVAALDAGANDYLRKPYEPVELAARIKVLAKLQRRTTSLEAQLATTLRSIGDAVISTDARGFVQFMNDVACQLTGWAQADAAGRPLADVFKLLRESDRAIVGSPVDLCLREGRIVARSSHMLLVRRDGAELPIEDSAAPIRDAAGVLTGVVLVFRDISDKKAAEVERDRLLAQTRNAEQNLRATFEQSIVASALIEGSDLVFTFANPAFRALVSGRDVVDKPLLEALPEMRGAGFDALLHGVIATGTPYIGEEVPIVLAHHATGECGYFTFSYVAKRSPTGATDGVIVTAIDVTAQVLARQLQERAATAVRASEEHLRRAIDASQAGLWDLELATGHMDSDARAVALMGLPEGSAVTFDSGLRQLPVEDQDRVTSAINAAVSTGAPYRMEYRTGGSGGVPLQWVDSRAIVEPAADGAATWLHGSMIDITARKLAEAERESMIDALAAQPMLRVCVLRGPQLVFEMVNPAYQRQIGGARVLVGRPLLEALPELVGTPFAAQLLQTIETGEPFIDRESTALLDRGDGVLVANYFSIVCQPLRNRTGVIDGVLVMANDTTDAVKVREELQASRTQLQAVFQLAPALLALLEGPDHRFALANPRFRELMGGRELVGHTVAEALPEMAEQGFVGLLDEVRRTGVPWLGNEIWLKVARGADRAFEEICVNVVYQPILAAGNRVDTIFAHAVVVTDLVRAREASQRLEANAKERGEFERQLIGIVSHDLRTPLSTISLGTTLLIEREAIDPCSLRTLTRMKSAAERGTRMVSDLLDFTQARVGGGIPVLPAAGNLHTLVRQVVDDVSVTSPDREVRVAIAGDGHGVWDLDRMAQVIANLVSNAVKYSLPGSVITVTSETSADGVSVEVHNLGAPISEAALTRIFQPMQRATSQLENKARSVGLGLYIVKHLVEAHGGRISVTSSEAEGTTFAFWVPKHANV